MKVMGSNRGIYGMAKAAGLATAALLLGFTVSGCLVECDLNGQTFTSQEIPVDSSFTANVDAFWNNSCFGKRGFGDARDFGTYQIVYDANGNEEPDTNRTQELMRSREKCEWREPPGNGRDYLIHEWKEQDGPYDANWTEDNRNWCLAQKGDKVVRFVSWDTTPERNYRQENWREPWILPPPCGGQGQPCCGNSCNASLTCMGGNNNGSPSPYLCSNIFAFCRCGQFTPRGNGQSCYTNWDCASNFCRVNTGTGSLGVCSQP